MNSTGKDDVVLHAVENVTTDIAYIRENPDEISPEGFSIFANHYSGFGLEVITDFGALSGSMMVNAPLAWANLHRDYHKHFRYMPTGIMNNVDTTFLSFRPNIKQVPFGIKLCCDITVFKPSHRIITELSTKYIGSNGYIKDAEYNPKTEVLKLNIEYSY